MLFVEKQRYWTAVLAFTGAIAVSTPIPLVADPAERISPRTVNLPDTAPDFLLGPECLTPSLPRPCKAQ